MNKKLSAGVIVALIIIVTITITQTKKAKAPTPDDIETTKEQVVMQMKESQPKEDEMMKELDISMMEAMKGMEFDSIGELEDVTNGQTIRGTAYDGNASGLSKATYSKSGYALMAEFKNLPEPTGSDFYEGWIVRQSPFDFISTGKLEKTDGQYQNTYASEQDLTDHDFYVLTLEPDDNNPAPADHILEGTMMK